jgi:hypothetical protein
MSEDDVECEESLEGKENLKKTPKKTRLAELENEVSEVRRSPRKHPGSRTPGFSKLTITGSAIVQQNKVKIVTEFYRLYRGPTCMGSKSS